MRYGPANTRAPALVEDEVLRSVPPPRRPRRSRTVLFILATTLVSLSGCDDGAPNPKGNERDDSSSPWFVETAADRGLVFVHQSGHRGRHLMPQIMGGGAALSDMDGDGDLDAYLVQSGRIVVEPKDRPPNQLFENLGDGMFKDVTTGSGADDRGYGMGVATGDYDNDGDVDLYITNVGPNVLLRNDGSGRFTDVTSLAGVGHTGWSTSAAFLDYDADGDLDLFVASYLNWSVATELGCYNDLTGEPDYCSPRVYRAPAVDVLYENRGDGTFVDVTDEAGINQGVGTGLGVVCGDFNHDGWIDIFVANDGMRDQLWINLGTGRFVDKALAFGCAVDQEGRPKAGMGVAAADIDDDGDLDLIVCNLHGESDSFYVNQGQFFSDYTPTSGLTGVNRPFTRFGIAWLDFNNDGFLDLYEANGRVSRQPSAISSSEPFAEPNILFRGTASGRFEEQMPRGGTKASLIATSRAAAFGDIDNDGGIDILIVNRDGPAHLLHNVVKQRGRWILFRILDEHGRDALGATLTLRVGSRVITRDVRTTYSYCAANDPRIHVGLAEARAVQNVTVHWPDGATEHFGTFSAGQQFVLRRNHGIAQTDAPPSGFRLARWPLPAPIAPAKPPF